MKTLRNQNGFALPFVLVLAAIALAITLAMFVMLGRGSFVSGQQKRYRTAVEASRGGMESMMQLIASRGIAAPYMTVPNPPDVGTKLAGPVGTWGTLNSEMTIDPGDPATYDMRIDLGTYRAYTKIVDTVEGNSGADEGLSKTGVVNTGTGEVTVVSVPYLYTIEVLSQSQVNPTERSKISALYEY